MAKDMNIGEVARQAGIRPSAIRYYESMHVLPTPRLENNKRCYTADIFQRLALIKMAQQVGLTVAEMRIMLNEPRESVFRAQIYQKLIDVEKRMQQLARIKAILEGAPHQEHLSVEVLIDLFSSLVQATQGKVE